jgi:hypothetical protein
MAPGGTTNRFQDVDPLCRLCRNGKDVVAETKQSVEGDAEDFRGFIERNSDAVDRDVRPGVTLLGLWREQCNL